MKVALPDMPEDSAKDLAALRGSDKTG